MDVMARHRTPDPDDSPTVSATPAPVPAVGGATARRLSNSGIDFSAARTDLLLAQQQGVMLWINVVAAGGLLVNAAGASPGMQFLTSTGIPLPVWGCVWLVVVALLGAGIVGYPVQEYAHVLAFFLWAFTGTGAVRGLVTKTTVSASSSIMLTGLITGLAGWHVVALLYRRRVARLRPKDGG